MRTTFRQSIIVTTAIIGLGAGAAIAAPPGAADPLAGHPHATTNNQSDGRAPRDANHGMEGRVEQRISDLHAKLHISPAQQPLWERFTMVMRENARGMDRSFQHRVQTMPGMTAAENMQSYAQVAMEHAEDVQRLVPTFQALYDTMSDHQKRMADQVFRDGANRGASVRHG